MQPLRIRLLFLGGVICLSALPDSSAIFVPSQPEGPPAYCTVFNHMVKSGGTTVIEQLFRSSKLELQNRPGKCSPILSDPLRPECLDAMYNSSVIVGYGEIMRRGFEHIGRECEFFTMMRHPIDRLVSAFFYCPTDHDVQHRPKRLCGNADVQQPMPERLLEFATSIWKNKTLDQMLLLFVCPLWLRDMCQDDPEATLGKIPHLNLNTKEGRDAVTRVQTTLGTYIAVGIAEHWELSMALFDATVKSPVRKWNPNIVSNIGPKNYKKKEVLDWANLSHDLHGVIAADMLLYDIAMDIFKNKTAESLGVEWN